MTKKAGRATTRVAAPSSWLLAVAGLGLGPGLGLGLACGGATGSDSSEVGSAEASESSSASSSAETGDATGQETGAGSSLAHDITISRVEITQGVAVPIGNAEGWVGAEGRNTSVLPERNALIRVYWERDAAFVDRDIEARLRLTWDGGREVMRSQILTIDREASERFLDRSFYFDVLAEDMTPDLRYQVEFHEVDPSFFGDEPAQAPIVPAQPELVGVEATPADMKVVVVPLVAAWGSCSAQPDLSEAKMQAFEDSLYERNPLRTLEFSITDPVTIDWEPSSLWETLAVLQQVREDESAPPNTYYYGLLNACGAGDINGAGGMAFDIVGDGMELGYQRVSVGLQMANNTNFNQTTFAHEIGHLQGSYHVSCDGEPMPPAPTETSFPHPDGSIGAWGFGLRNFALHNPANARDYMSYCYTASWISDWNWTRFYGRAKTLTSWDQGDVEPPPGEALGHVLIGVRDAQRERWWVARGALPEGAPAKRAVTHAGAPLRGVQSGFCESEAEVVIVELPHGYDPDELRVADANGQSRQIVLVPPR